MSQIPYHGMSLINLQERTNETQAALKSEKTLISGFVFTSMSPASWLSVQVRK